MGSTKLAESPEGKKKVKARKEKPAAESVEAEAAEVVIKKAKKAKADKRKDGSVEGKQKKKRKLEETEETAAQPPKKAKKAKAEATPPASDASDDTAIMSADEDSAPSTPAQPADPLAVDNFALSEGVKAALRTKQIKSLFDIQAKTLSHVLNGKDLLGRARTGCGKTLAFVLPIVETLGKAGTPGFGRTPRAIVLAPTRELAKQVHADFVWIGDVFRLKCVCIYGGSAYGPQESSLRRGVDVVIGTPGRVKDMLERGTLKLAELKFRVLDECDEMLNMGFVDDVEKILNAGGSKDIQTLLFSATLPPWVKDIQRRFLKSDFTLVDLVGNEKQKASTSVRHVVLPCHWSQRESVAADCVRTYGSHGRTIVFTDTKRDANELATGLESFGARPLHGDIPQSTRETTLAGFRAGKFKVLVATDVAARGLDISGVELVLQCEPPKDPENYIHRSGRTGRAGCTGMSITLCDRKKEGLIPFIERRAGFKFERVGAPQPVDMAKQAGQRAAEALQKVDAGVVPYFKEAAEKLLTQYDDPAEALARALAQVTGHTKFRARSLLTSHEQFTTLQYHGNCEIHKPGLVWAFLKRSMPEDVVEQVQRLTLTADGMNAVFDVPSDSAQDFLDAYPAPKNAQQESNIARGVLPAQPYLTAPTQLPALKEKEGQAPSYPEFGGGRGNRFSMGRRGGDDRGRRGGGGGGGRRFGGGGGGRGGRGGGGGRRRF